MKDALVAERGAFLRRAPIDPTAGPLFSSILRFSLPVILANIFSALYTSADMMVLSWFSNGNEVASVGASSPVAGLILSFSLGLGTGSTVILSRLFGRKDAEGVHRALSTILISAVSIGLILGVLGSFFMRSFLVWTNCPAECLEDSTLYAVLVMLGLPFTILYNYAASAIRVSGDSKRPLYYMLIGGVLNVVLNVLFCVILPRKVLAVVLATLISNAVCAFMCVYRMLKNKGLCHFDFKRLSFDFSIFGQLLRYGLPTALSSSLFPLANIQMQSAINSFGPSAIAGNTASIQYENFCSNISLGLNMGATTFIGQNMGANQKDRAIRSFFLVLVMNLVTMIIFPLLILLFGRSFVSVFTGSDLLAIETGFMRLSYLFPFYWIALNPFNATITTMGYPGRQTAISLVGICGFRTVWMQLIYGRLISPTLANVYLCFPFSIILTHTSLAIITAVLLVRYKNGRLKDKI